MLRIDELRRKITYCKKRITETNGSIESFSNKREGLLDERKQVLTDSGRGIASNVLRSVGFTTYRSGKIPDRIAEIDGEIAMLDARIEQDKDYKSSVAYELNEYEEELNASRRGW